MDTESARVEPPPLFNRGFALKFKYNAIAMTILNAIVSLGWTAVWLIRWTRLNERLRQDRFSLLFFAIVVPLLTPYTAFEAWRLTKKLTSGAEYRKEIMWTIWFGLNLLLFGCYLILLSVVEP
jgi:hypothetical protein